MAYDKEFLISEIQRYFKEFGKVPRNIDMDKTPSYPSGQTFYTHFGSWNNALKSAGFDIIKYDKETLISELHRYYTEFGKVPSVKDINNNKDYPSEPTFSKYFGSWNKALKEAGFELKEYNKEILISEIHRYYNEFNKVPNSEDINKNPDYPSTTAYRNHFGSWGNALKESGLNDKKIELETVDILKVKENLISDLHRYYNEFNVTPTMNGIIKNPNYPSISQYTIHFGSWNNALKTAGFRTHTEKYSKKELKYIYLKYVADHDEKPSINKLKKEKIFPYSAMRSKFGSKKHFMHRCGFLCDDRYNNRYTNEELISELHKYYKEFNKIPTSTDFNKNPDLPSKNAYKKHFGSWNNALKIAGLEINHCGKYDKEFLISELHRYFDEYGQIPTSTFMEKINDYPSFTAYRSHFGTWNNALKSAGFETKEVPEYNKEILISELHRYYKEFNKIPSMKLMNQAHGYPYQRVFEKHFGSWNNALKEAGFEINRVRKHDKETLISEIHRYIKEFGKIPTIDEMDNNPDYPSSSVYTNHFGSWSKALIAIGFEPNIKTYTDEELISEIKRYYKEFNKLPKAKDFEINPDYPSVPTYVKRFGSWSNAIKMSGFIPKYKHYTDYELITELQRYFKEFGKIPSASKMDKTDGYPCATIYQKRFGSWSNALKEAGLKK